MRFMPHCEDVLRLGRLRLARRLPQILAVTDYRPAREMPIDHVDGT
jgi:hypothetical protein